MATRFFALRKTKQAEPPQRFQRRVPLCSAHGVPTELCHLSLSCLRAIAPPASFAVAR